MATIDVPAIINALDDAERRHGPLTTDPVRACAIMMREAGEAMNEALLATKPTNTAPLLRMELLYIELSQVIATCIRIQDNLAKEHPKCRNHQL